MRIALFFVINIAVALAVALFSASQDQSAGTILLRVIGALVVLQLAYVAWLVAMSWLRPVDDTKTEHSETRATEPPANSPTGKL